MTDISVLVHSLTMSGAMIDWFCNDLSDTEMHHRPCDGANCAAWIVGHLTDYDHKVAARLGATKLVTLPPGFSDTYSREGSAPKAETFGDCATLRSLFKSARSALIDLTTSLSAEKLTSVVDKPTARYRTVSEMLGFMGLHTALHAGQITIIRRSLGRPPLI